MAFIGLKAEKRIPTNWGGQFATQNQRGTIRRDTRGDTHSQGYQFGGNRFL
jgi:hypothetical protein